MVKQMGNIEFLILAIGSVVFFTLLLVTGNTMAIAVRERTNELAVLKAIGFTSKFVLGDRAGRVAADRGDWRRDRAVARARHRGAGPHQRPAPAVSAARRRSCSALAIALVTGLMAGLLPAVNAMRLNVATALRRL